MTDLAPLITASDPLATWGPSCTIEAQQADITKTRMITPESLASKLQSMLLERLEKGKLVLPVMSGAAIKVQELLDDPRVEIAKIGKIIETDPVLSTKILAAANSAAFSFGARSEIASIPRALARIGMRNLKRLLYTAVAHRVFASRNKEVNRTLEEIWQHSLAVALIAQDVAGLADAESPEEAYLTGLLHDIGKAIVGVYLLEVERSLLSKAAGRSDWLDHHQWIDVVDRLHRPVGAAVAKKWNLPSAVSDAIIGAADYDPAARASTGNIVRFANAVVTRAGLYVGNVNLEESNALLMVGRSLLNIDDDVVERLVMQVSDKLAASGGN